MKETLTLTAPSTILALGLILFSSVGYCERFRGNIEDYTPYLSQNGIPTPSGLEKDPSKLMFKLMMGMYNDEPTAKCQGNTFSNACALTSLPQQVQQFKQRKFMLQYHWSF